jgi:hypothetical protein
VRGVTAKAREAMADRALVGAVLPETRWRSGGDDLQARSIAKELARFRDIQMESVAFSLQWWRVLRSMQVTAMVDLFVLIGDRA